MPRPPRIISLLFAITLAAATLLCGAVGARADDAPPLVSGAQVRVRPGTGGNPRIGTLIALDDTVLTMRLGAGEAPSVIRRSDITSVDVSAGRHSRWRKALIGAGIGVGAGVLIGFALGDDRGASDDSELAFTAGEKAFGLAIVLGPVGGIVGAAVTPGEKWRGVEPSGLRLSLGASPGRGITVALTTGW